MSVGHAMNAIARLEISKLFRVAGTRALLLNREILALLRATYRSSEPGSHFDPFDDAGT
jgi:hypothetical protein